MTDQVFIPYGKQDIDKSDLEAVCTVLRSSWLTTGPLVDQFEEAIAEKCGAKYCVVFNSGTAALHAAYHAAGVGPGSEVITTPITFAATANAALYLGAKPVFADVEPDTFHIDPAKIGAALSSRTRVIAPVDMAGTPAALDEINRLAADHNITVVEDASHALGAYYKGLVVGSIADMTVFSFHPVKHITTGEGGAVTTSDQELYFKMRSFRSHGMVREADRFTAASEEEMNRGPWYHEQQELGYNYRLPDINCALGLSQLKRVDGYLERRRAIAAKYNEAFQGNDRLKTPPEMQGSATLAEAAWHLYILRLAGEKPPRRCIVDKLKAAGIGTQVHYIPVYLHPYYRQLGYKTGLCPNAEDYYSRALSIPIYPAMSDEDVERVIEAVLIAVEACY